MQVRVHCAARDFFSQSQLPGHSLTVFTQPPCAIACINICAHIKNPIHWQPYHYLDTWKYCTHQQEWVALVLQLLRLTQVRWPKFPASDIGLSNNRGDACSLHTSDMSEPAHCYGFSWNCMDSLLHFILLTQVRRPKFPASDIGDACSLRTWDLSEPAHCYGFSWNCMDSLLHFILLLCCVI